MRGGLVPPGDFIPRRRAHRRDRRAGRLGPARRLPPGRRVGRARAQAERRLQRVAAAAPSPRRGASGSPRSSTRTGSSRAGSCSRSPSPPGRSRPRACCRCSASSVPPASRWRSTTSAPATRRCGGCASCRCRSSRSTARSCAASRRTRRATAVYSAILQLADACGCDVVAEGVERAEHADFLAARGCQHRAGLPLLAGRSPGRRVTELLLALGGCRPPPLSRGPLRPFATLHGRHGCPEAEAVARSYEQAPRAAQDHRAVGERLPAVPPAAPAAPRVPALRQLRRA